MTMVEASSRIGLSNWAEVTPGRVTCVIDITAASLGRVHRSVLVRQQGRQATFRTGENWIVVLFDGIAYAQFNR